MDIKVGIVESPREITIQTDAADNEVLDQVKAAVEGTANILFLTDTKGKRYLIPAARIAYVELGKDQERRVGFSI